MYKRQGMSGAGKTTALKMLEDMGFYCVDNLPIRLIEKFVELIKGGGTEANDIALGIDIRNPEFIGLMSEVITQLKQEEIDCKVLFLEASDECLITVSYTHLDVYKRQSGEIPERVMP